MPDLNNQQFLQPRPANTGLPQTRCPLVLEVPLLKTVMSGSITTLQGVWDFSQCTLFAADPPPSNSPGAEASVTAQELAEDAVDRLQACGFIDVSAAGGVTCMPLAKASIAAHLPLDQAVTVLDDAMQVLNTRLSAAEQGPPTWMSRG